MKKITFEYFGVLYYYFLNSHETYISKSEMDDIADFAMGYLYNLKSYNNNPDVTYYLTISHEMLEKKLATIPFMWYGDPETKRPVKASNAEELSYIGCDNLDELRMNYPLFLLTTDSKDRKNLEEAVKAYIDFKKEKVEEYAKEEKLESRFLRLVNTFKRK